MAARYAVVESAGMHNSGAQIYAEYTANNLNRARLKAAKWTRDLRRICPGSTESYEVIECGLGCVAGSILGRGHDVDRMPRL